MKKLIACCFALATLVSCNKKQETTTETTMTDSTVVVTDTANTASAEFKPFDVITIKHSVKDYAKWRPLFDADSVARNEAGMKLITVSRGIDKPNEINIALEISDVQKARDFAKNPRLKGVMDKAGVNSAPIMDYVNVIRFDKEAMAQKDYLEVTHKVKDFDAWLKVYDAEGPAKRLGEGLKDMVLARNIDDPNTVNIVFAVTDMAKAKAAINSEAKKKLMNEAGVEGKPRLLFYHMQE